MVLLSNNCFKRSKKMKYRVFISIISLLLHQFSTIEAKKNYLDAVKIVNSINNNTNLPWKASTYGERKVDEDLLKRTKLGAKINITREASIKQTLHENMQLATANPHYDRTGLPVNFTWADPNNQTHNCSIGHAVDQSNCGSSWAIFPTKSLADRMCVQTRGKTVVSLSYEHVLSCNTENDGCDGGYRRIVNNYLRDVGTITGGDYESDQGCQTYSLRPCGFPQSTSMPCPRKNARTPRCKRRKCNNDWYEYDAEPDSRVYKAKKWYWVESNSTHTRESCIRDEIYRNGPVTASFIVPNDFYFYKKGVYVSDFGKRNETASRKSVNLIGWGVENDLKYWHAVNSWGPYWGENGLFKILRGVNMLEIEEWVTALVPTT